jgi:hypothetical protein
MYSSEKNKIPVNDNVLNEPTADYEKAEVNLLKEALNRSYTERFLMTTRLYKIQATLNRAKITHNAYNLKK